MYKTNWQLTEYTGVEVQFFDSGNCRIDIDFGNKSIANSKNDFSQFTEIKEKLNNGNSLTYDEFVKIIGGVDGVLETKATSFLGYKWINEDGGYLTVQFDPETLECKAVSGNVLKICINNNMVTLNVMYPKVTKNC